MINKISSIQELSKSLQSIIVKDYGDFKRKAVLYFNRFLESEVSAQHKKSLEKLIHQLQFQPNFDIEKTRSIILQKLRELNK